NKYLKACIKNITQDSQISTSELLVYYYNKKLEREETPELNVEINEVDSTSKGTGYTFPEQIGRTLGKGRVTANIETDYGINYTIHFELLTGSDFLSIEVE
ncbi:MAG: hypothetical protein MUP58_03680, partial [Candidatus Nanohaloarchaeota archaeon QJJ-9]|nr:hypothetical protein [Candidatus Nanohaloarchaeota archaeon QJJ-9]